MSEEKARAILKEQGMTDEEANDFIDGCKKGIKAMKDGWLQPLSKVIEELGESDVPLVELSDLDLADLNVYCDKLDNTGSQVYAIQFNEFLEELSRTTGLSIPEIKNRAREYRKRR